MLRTHPVLPGASRPPPLLRPDTSDSRGALSLTGPAGRPRGHRPVHPAGPSPGRVWRSLKAWRPEFALHVPCRAPARTWHGQQFAVFAECSGGAPRGVRDAPVTRPAPDCRLPRVQYSRLRWLWKHGSQADGGGGTQRTYPAKVPLRALGLFIGLAGHEHVVCAGGAGASGSTARLPPGPPRRRAGVVSVKR